MLILIVMMSKFHLAITFGFRTTVLPITSAIGTVQKGTMNGKLKGTMLATTPSASLRSTQLTAPDTFNTRP